MCHKQIVVLVLFFVVAYCVSAGSFPLFDLDEGAFSQATLEMQYRGNYIATYLNDVPRYDKPIFAYWTQLFFVKLLGSNDLAFRAASIFAAACWASLIFSTVSKLYGNKQAFWACLVFMSSLITLIVGKAATADSLLNLFIAITQIHLFLYLNDGKKSHLIWASAAAGLGFMTKGPVAILVPFLTVLFFTISERRWHDFIHIIKSIRAWFIFSAIALPWYFWISYVEGFGFIKGFILEHNIGRFSQSMESHSGPVYFYLLLIPLMILPHSHFIPAMVLKVVGSWRNDSFIRFLVIWFLIVFIIFSFSATKLPHYLLYGLTPVFIILGLVISETQPRSWFFFPVLLVAVLAFFLPDLMTDVSQFTSDVYMRDMLDQVDLSIDQQLIIFLSIGLIVMLIFITAIGRLPTFFIANNGGYLIALVLNVLLINSVYISLAAKVQQEPIREAAYIAKSLNKDVVVWRLRMPSFSVYFGGVVRTAEPSIGQVFLTNTKHIKDMTGYQVIFKKRGIILAEKIND